MTQRNPAFAASTVALLVLLAGCTTATTTLEADLAGPDAGDPDGTGSATITLDEAGGEVCWDITVQGIGTATAAHIHRGTASESGPVVVPLSAPSDGSAEGCTDADGSLISEIEESPSEFYVNVHNDEFPGGAIRGQLSG